MRSNKYAELNRDSGSDFVPRPQMQMAGSYEPAIAKEETSDDLLIRRPFSAVRQQATRTGRTTQAW
jgi:hypothetical protein